MPLYGYFAPTASSNTSGTPGMRFDYSISSSSSSRTSENPSGISDANTEEETRRNEYIKTTGKIYSLNTLESFKTINKNTFLNESCLPSLLSCCGVKATTGQLSEDGGSSSNSRKEDDEEDDDKDDKPNKSLVSTACITYCNLKTNLIVYWFGYPALVPQTGCGIAYCASSSSNCCQQKLVDAWGSRACRILSHSFHKFRIQQEDEHDANETNGGGGHHDLVWCPPFFMILPDSNSSEMKNIKCLPLNKCTYNALSEEDRERVIFAFVDPNTTAAASTTTADEPEAVGWTLRNLVAYLSLRFRLGGCHRTFLSYRSPLLRRVTSSDEVKIDSNGVEEEEYVNMKMRESFEDIGGEEQDDTAGIGGSLLLDIAVPLASDYQWPTATSSEATASSNDYNLSLYRCVGWELNKNNKPGPRSIDLRPLVSPAHLSRQANDLNLRLMKWRALPSLDVEKLSKLKVLLLGAGTLGCGVARTLLGWGIRKITFVDSGRVSYSNPVRQSLFGVDDCKDGGKYKAVAAAESLVAIAGTDVKSAGVVLTIPMPGHSFGKGKDGSGETEAVRKDVERLHSLIDESDVVFLLTDTRESRWLPTVIALATETPLINSALGLDSWLVMRHGPSSSCLSSSPVVCSTNNQQQQRLGCYFCSDVVAPENSTRDRTLDQQCTVTRPGLAPIAASMATELMVAMFHHEFGHCAPAPGQKRDNNYGAYAPRDDGTDASSSVLGRLPHQIRGTVVTYTMMTPTIPAFPSCTACSDNVVKEYQKQRFDFVKCVCCDEDGSYLEKVSGLATFREEADKKLDECFDWDDEMDDDEDE